MEQYTLAIKRKLHLMARSLLKIPTPAEFLTFCRPRIQA